MGATKDQSDVTGTGQSGQNCKRDYAGVPPEPAIEMLVWFWCRSSHAHSRVHLRNKRPGQHNGRDLRARTPLPSGQAKNGLARLVPPSGQ